MIEILIRIMNIMAMNVLKYEDLIVIYRTKPRHNGHVPHFSIDTIQIPASRQLLTTSSINRAAQSLYFLPASVRRGYG